MRDLDDKFIFTGALNDDEKWLAYRRAECFVLPTHTENFGIVIAEALYAGLPVITTKNAPWEGLRENNCGWWIELNYVELVGALRQAMTISAAEREAMGARGNKFVCENFAWPAIAERFVLDCKKVLER